MIASFAGSWPEKLWKLQGLQLLTAIAAFFFKHGIEYDEHYLWD